MNIRNQAYLYLVLAVSYTSSRKKKRKFFFCSSIRLDITYESGQRLLDAEKRSVHVNIHKPAIKREHHRKKYNGHF